MAWLIQHKCNMEAAPTNYGLLKVWTDDAPRRPLTKIVCPGACREEFYVLGHELFDEAALTQTGRDQSPSLTGLPPGFMVPKMHVPG